MKINNYWTLAATLAAVAVICPETMYRASAAADAPSVQVLVTAEGQKGAAPELRQGDVMMYENRERVPVTAVMPMAGQPVELYLAIDEMVGDDFPTHLSDLKNFIDSQPPNVAIGVVYLRDGGIDIRQKPTSDHAAAAKSLRLTVPNVGSSPFESMKELVKQWPESSARREVVMISSGIEPFGGAELSNPFVDEAVAAVQRAGIPVFTIYTHAQGHWGHTFWRTTWGETFLSRLSDESGGEGYDLTGIKVVSFSPFLNDISARLQHQYRVAFTPNPQSKPGFVPLRASTEVPHIQLLTQDRVWVGEE